MCFELWALEALILFIGCCRLELSWIEPVQHEWNNLDCYRKSDQRPAMDSHGSSLLKFLIESGQNSCHVIVTRPQCYEEFEPSKSQISPKLFDNVKLSIFNKFSQISSEISKLYTWISIAGFHYSIKTTNMTLLNLFFLVMTENPTKKSITIQILQPKTKISIYIFYFA